jgi:hypothetical protein
MLHYRSHVEGTSGGTSTGAHNPLGLEVGNNPQNMALQQLGATSLRVQLRFVPSLQIDSLDQRVQGQQKGALGRKGFPQVEGVGQRE